MSTSTEDIKATNRSTLAAIIIAIVSALLSGWVGYSHNDKEISNRVVAVETQQKNDHEGITRVEGKVDKVDSKVDRLVEWAFGSKK